MYLLSNAASLCVYIFIYMPTYIHTNIHTDILQTYLVESIGSTTGWMPLNRQYRAPKVLRRATHRQYSIPEMLKVDEAVARRRRDCHAHCPLATLLSPTAQRETFGTAETLCRDTIEMCEEREHLRSPHHHSSCHHFGHQRRSDLYLEAM